MLSADDVREILKKALPPDNEPAQVLGGLMVDFVARLAEAEVKIEKLGKFAAFQKEAMKQMAEKIKTTEPTQPAATAEKPAEAPAEGEGEPVTFVGPPNMAPPGAIDPAGTAIPNVNGQGQA